MPTVTFKDGTSVFVQDTKPETLKKAELDYLANQRKNTVPLEEIASGVQRGIIGIAEGLVTIPTTVYDHLMILMLLILLLNILKKPSLKLKQALVWELNMLRSLVCPD
jgi:hypothetical protein